MDSVKKQLESFSERYSSLIRLAVSNMRLILLVVFSVLAGYLVLRVDSLLNLEAAPEESAASQTSLNKKPDDQLLSIFNELYEQRVEIDSEFQPDRDNPF